MIKRTIEISAEPAHLAVKLDQLLIRKRGEDPRYPAASIPCEDIGLVVVDHPAVSYSHAALARLVECGAAVLICGQNHLPAGLLLPLSEHSEIVWRMDDQISASRPLRKRLWQQIVIAKVKAQAANLHPDCPERQKLLALAGEVKSGDPANIEAQAARVYWSAWLAPGCPFRRDPDRDDLNALLNYGYSVVRAAVARALVGAGLQPALGIHHANRANPFCLADDLMEPLRPLVDAKVRELAGWELRKVDARTKPALLKLLVAEVALRRIDRAADGRFGPDGRLARQLPGRNTERAHHSSCFGSPPVVISGYRCMWIVVMFDLPVDTKSARRAYTQFRTKLLLDGFTRMQFSVYIRHCASEENAAVHFKRVEDSVPPDGEVRIIGITDKQFERMRIYWGKRRKPPEHAPAQLELF